MRLLPALFGAVLAAFAMPALADTIVDTVAFDNPIADIGTVLVFGPGFDTSLGTLTGVSLAVSGTYTPDIFVQNPPTTSTNLYYTWNSYSHNSATGLLGTFNLTLNGYFLTGPAEVVHFSTGPLLNVDNYTDFGSEQTVFLSAVGAYSRLTTGPTGGGNFDDISDFSGNLQVTYTYTVPEPSSLLLLAGGACVLSLLRGMRRSRAAKVVLF